MSQFKIFAAAALAATVAGSAYADDGIWSLGAAAYIQNSPYKETHTKVRAVPLVGYEGKNFYLRGFNGGYYLWNDDTNKLSIAAWYSPLRFRPKDSGDHQMRRLDYRKSTMMAGLNYAHYTQYGYLRTWLGGDVLGESNGVTWDLAWLYRYTNGRLTVTPGIGATWNSENQNQYYYGVRHSESSRSGIRHYNADSDWNPYAELTINYNLTDHWSIYGIGRYIRLGDEVKDSPMVDRSWMGMLLTGVNYRF